MICADDKVKRQPEGEGRCSMIPLSLSMRNFMCYGDHVSSLDFSGIHLVCLAGDNGHGKSAIIDAMTWALWGKARAVRDDELIHLGAREMEVDFEFLLSDNHYRVLRQRQKNGSRGSTTLEFQVLDQGQFRSLTANSVRQTQAAITETLHIEYDTFINSAFLLQGRADEFTAHPASERKRILGEILDLSYYDLLEERAKQRSRETELALREIGSALTEIEKELAHRPEYEEDLKRSEEVSSGLSARLRVEEAALRDLQAQSRELELRQEELRALALQKQRGDAEIAQTKRETADTQQRIDACQEVLEQAEIIEQGYQQLLAARQADEELSRKLTHHAQLCQQRADTVRALDAARGQLAVERERLVSTMDALERTAHQEEQLEQRFKEVHAQVVQLSGRKEQRDQLLAQEQELSNQIATLRAHNQQLKSEMGLLREKLDLLKEAEAICPLCGSELQEGERENIEQNYERDGKERGDLHRENAAAIERLRQDLAETRQAREQGDVELSALASSRGEEDSLLKALRDAQAAAQDLAQIREKLTLVDQRLEEEDYAQAERQRMKDLAEELTSLGYDAEEHEQIRRSVTESAHFETDRRSLDTASESLRSESQRLVERDERLANLQQAVAELSQNIDVLSNQVDALQEATRGLPDLTTRVEQLQIDEADARVRLGAARQKLDHCSYLEAQSAEKARQEREAQKEKAIYDELRLAFGKKGMQAMIIEAVIPEIEEEANLLLNRMTDGRLSVRLLSQRETLKGSAVETLDIEVADELGPRSYALFSGGEAFRINFAIRVALSKLLARRAGARLQTLIIDEGFGTQDVAGRQRLLEAIHSVQGDFELILVVTHLEELKDSFPVRIDVFKTPLGSEISVA